MALIIRLDIDRPYGRRPFARHVLSRISSDFYFPRIQALSHLRELEVILDILRRAESRAYLFFRRCTFPSHTLMNALDRDGHKIGLHLEDSRNFETFCEEKQAIEQYFGRAVVAFSKHGSGRHKYGWKHHAPYEPDKYIEWARKAGMTLFLGNLEDPTMTQYTFEQQVLVFPSAFWLEPSWRDTSRYCVEWLEEEALHRDIVLLVHPENIVDNPELLNHFSRIISKIDYRMPV